MAKRAERKQAKDIEWLKVSSRQIGEGAYGKVYTGRIKFRGQRPTRVAVKRFHLPIDAHLASYEAVIRKLRAARVKIVKTGFVKLDTGEHVQVQPLFGATVKGSKLNAVFLRQRSDYLGHVISSKFIDSQINLSNKATRRGLISKLASIVNAGYPPMFDAVSVMKTRTAPAFVVHDLDLLAKHERGECEAGITGRQLYRWIIAISENAKIPPKEIKQEFVKAIRHPEGIRALRGIIAT
ncbi:MAG: hypothetical protein Q8R15_02260 [Candidatus Micrarchaeota archaeon]|nr:hypothetical protein [Candidatus Micrarchaeota archaeon]